MGIDGIGKGAKPPAPDPHGGIGSAGSVEKKAPVEKAFSTTMQETEATRGAAQVGQSNAASSPLARFRAGEVDVNGYVDLKVDEVVGNLKGLSPAELDDIRKMLRDQITTDPGLADLVRTATGQVPTPPED
jgi:hypothetical protein